MPTLLDGPVNDRSMLLEWSLQRLLAESPPPEITRAAEALARAEISHASNDVAAYVRPTLQWLVGAADVVFSMPADPTVAGEVMRLARLAVDQGPLHAAFSGWRLRFTTHGLWLALVDRLREVAVEYGVTAHPLGPTEASLAGYPLRAPQFQGTRFGGDWTASVTYSSELFLLMCDELKQLIGAQSALDEIRAVLNLSETDLAALLSVRRQAVTQWRMRGIPANRIAQIDEYLQLCRYLSKAFAGDRIPAIVRRPVPNLNGKSWLEHMEEHGPEETHERLRAVLSYQLI